MIGNPFGLKCSSFGVVGVSDLLYWGFVRELLKKMNEKVRTKGELDQRVGKIETYDTYS